MSNPQLRRVVGGRSRTGCTSRILLALVLIAFAYFQFLASTEKVVNPYTGEKQRIALTPQQEMAMGLQAAPQMIRQYGGEHPDSRAQALVDQVGARLVAHIDSLATQGRPIDYPFEIHLLADERTINAFALPGGQIFITAALFRALESEAQLAGVLGHEAGHVIAKHSNEQMSKAGLLRGIGSAVGVAVGGENMASSAQVAGMVNHVLSTSYGRNDEYEADEIGALLMHRAGYDPAALIGVMEILRKAGGSGSQPEFLSTHPFPENRAERLRTVVLPGIGKLGRS